MRSPLLYTFTENLENVKIKVFNMNNFCSELKFFRPKARKIIELFQIFKTALNKPNIETSC